jgi:hypothetical protein
MCESSRVPPPSCDLSPSPRPLPRPEPLRCSPRLLCWPIASSHYQSYFCTRDAQGPASALHIEHSIHHQPGGVVVAAWRKFVQKLPHGSTGFCQPQSRLDLAASQVGTRRRRAVKVQQAFASSVIRCVTQRMTVAGICRRPLDICNYHPPHWPKPCLEGNSRM